MCVFLYLPRNFGDMCLLFLILDARIPKFTYVKFEKNWHQAVVLCYLVLSAFYVGFFSEINLISVKISILNGLFCDLEQVLSLILKTRFDSRPPEISKNKTKTLLFGHILDHKYLALYSNWYLFYRIIHWGRTIVNEHFQHYHCYYVLTTLAIITINNSVMIIIFNALWKSLW